LIRNQQVAGSSPASSSKQKGIPYGCLFVWFFHWFFLQTYNHSDMLSKKFTIPTPWYSFAFLGRQQIFPASPM
ncbi:MAG: hypothetical protein DBX39_03620, partial [Bacillota bacterium]